MSPAEAARALADAAASMARGSGGAALEKIEQLIAARERLAEAHELRSRALLLLNRDAEGLEAAEMAVRLEPTSVQAWTVKAVALASMGEIAAADKALAKCRALAPSTSSLAAHIASDARGLYVSRALVRQTVCDWSDRDRLIGVLRALIADSAPGVVDAGMVFYSLGLPLTAGEQRLLARRAIGMAADAGSLKPAPKRTNAKLKVGFLSAEIADHPGARLLLPLCRDRDRSRFEHHIYSLIAEEGSAIKKDLRREADGFFDVGGWTSGRIARHMRAEGLDVLMDMSGLLVGSRPEVLAARPAPLQISCLGTPCSLGARIVDYRLSDSATTPSEGQRDWDEALALLPPRGWAYDPGPRPELAGTRADHGLPIDGFVWCCFNQAFKIEPEVFSCWIRLLKAVPDSALWLLDGGASAVANLRRSAVEQGVDAGRLVFAPRLSLERHLARLGHADLFLDTFYCGAHTTALDALWMGVPVLTRRGETMASRLCATYVGAAGTGELIADDAEQYVAKGLQLARDRAGLAQIRRRLLAAEAPLFDTKARVRDFEVALAAIVERHRAGLPPDTLVIY